MIHKIITLLSLLLIILIIIYNSTSNYKKEHIGNVSDIEIANDFYDPNFIDPVIFNKHDSYDMGYIYYGTPYERGSKYVLPSGSSTLNKNDMLQNAINSRKLKLDTMIANIIKEEEAITKLESTKYPKVVSLVMKLTNNNPIASWEIISKYMSWYTTEYSFARYMTYKLYQKFGYYDKNARKELEKVDDKIFITLKENVAKRKEEIKEYIKKYKLDEPVIGTETTTGNIQSYDQKVEDAYA